MDTVKVDHENGAICSSFSIPYRSTMAPFGTRPWTDVTFGLTRLITLIGA